ncbi:MAG: IPT/TIG domain-containing protein [Bryobacteraceae bacterium]
MNYVSPSYANARIGLPEVWRRAGRLAAMPCALLLAAFWPGAAGAQAPSYAAADFVNASNYSAGPFAPNSVVSLFGSNLAFGTAAANGGAQLPTSLGNVSVQVSNTAVPLLYVSPGQINFLIPSGLIDGAISVQVERQGWVGPTVTLTLVDAAPAPFVDSQSFVLAEDWNQNYAVVNAANPAHPGDTIVLYLTGLGHTVPNPNSGEAPATAASLANPAELSVLLNGAPMDPTLILYAGLTPGFAGLYQINLMLPMNTTINPEICISMAGQTSPAGVLLAVEPVQLDARPARKQ